MKTYAQFVTDLGVRESSGDYGAVNQFGYLGRYQFGLARLSDLGLCKRRPGTRGPENGAFTWVSPYSQELFLTSPELQDDCFSVHVGKYRAWVAQRYQSVLGRTFCKTVIDMSAAIGVCHLLGPGGLMYLFQNHDLLDANGTHATDYAAKFSGYWIATNLPTSVTWQPAIKTEGQV
jgi:hypothetical protein